MGDARGLPGPTDAWITLAGLARETTTLRLGTMVNSATFRLPGPLSIIVAQVDQMSGGRGGGVWGGGLRGRAGWATAQPPALRHPVPPGRRTFRPSRGAARDPHRT